LIHTIILAGGRGIRFWPLSRETWPKQMLNILGEDTLLRQTVKRLEGFSPVMDMWIVTTESLVQDIRFHLQILEKNVGKIRFIIEPFGRNTAPAVGLAAITLNKISPDAIMMVLPSDHTIKDTMQFQEKLRLGIGVAEQGYLVTFGIKPNRPETGYGYIQSGHPLEGSHDKIYHIEKFLEKPDLKTAEAFILRGNFYWNSGIFVWKTSKILKEIENHLPQLYQGLKRIEGLKGLKGEGIQDIYALLDTISIDYGVLEKSQEVLVIPSDFGWSDLGSWAALDEGKEKDNSGNIFTGNTIDIGSRDSIVFSGERLVATIGLKNMVVVETPDAVLVTSKEKVQEVKKIVETLEKEGREEHLLPKTVERPWGSYTVLEKGSGYKIKRISLKPKARLSLQLHRRRSEHWVVVSGIAKVTRADETYLVHSNESTYIPINIKHRLENPKEVPLQVIEVQNGDYLGEDDIERFDDDYQRIEKD